MQTAGSMEQLREGLDTLGIERLGEHAHDTVLVRIYGSPGAPPLSLPGVSALLPFLPAYKPAPHFEEIVNGGPLELSVDPDGFVRFMTTWHSGEDPRDYVGFLEGAGGLPGLLPPTAALTYEAEDASGNVATQTVQVRVAHDRGRRR